MFYWKILTYSYYYYYYYYYSAQFYGFSDKTQTIEMSIVPQDEGRWLCSIFYYTKDL